MARYYFDISDVLEYFGYQLAASGIQRVQLEFIRHFAKSTTENCVFVLENPASHGFFSIDSGLLMALVTGTDEGSFTRKGMTEHLARIRASGAPATPQKGDVFFISGAFWAFSSTPRSLWNAKQSGARVGFLCYDLIALRQPEFCVAGLVEAFRSSFETIAHVVDFMFTISEHVKTDVDAYLAGMGITLPVIALPLAHDLAPQRGESLIGDAVQSLQGRPYVLFVSTIEARKNHIYIFTVWQRLLKSMPGQVPDLVWVGRPGWMVDDLMKRIDRLNHLDGKLHILNGLSDAELATLYKGCLFSVYPSLAEGWGLPVAESLMFAKPCLASNRDSIPEVGGDFVWYIDPLNSTDAVDQISNLLRHPDKIEAAAQRIRKDFRPRRWADVGNNLMAGFKRLEADRENYNPLVKMQVSPGLFYPLANRSVEGALPLNGAERMALDEGFDQNWHGREHWTRWLKGLSGSLHLSRDKGEGGLHCLRVKLSTFGHWTGKTIIISCPQSQQQAEFEGVVGSDLDVMFDMQLPSGDCDLVFRVDRADQQGADPRYLSIGLVAFGCAPRHDQQAVAALGQGFAAGCPGIKPEVTEIRFPVHVPLHPERHWIFNVLRRATEEGFAPTLGRIKRRIGM